MAGRNDIEVEASTIFGSLQDQLKCMGGMWPKSVTRDGKVFTQARKEYSGDGELEAVVYVAADGSRLFVLND
jgi:hypothetical protein